MSRTVYLHRTRGIPVWFLSPSIDPNDFDASLPFVRSFGDIPKSGPAPLSSDVEVVLAWAEARDLDVQDGAQMARQPSVPADPDPVNQSRFVYCNVVGCNWAFDTPFQKTQHICRSERRRA